MGAVALVFSAGLLLGTGEAANAQVVVFDDETVFDISTDAQNVPIPASEIAFPGTDCVDDSMNNDPLRGSGASFSITFDSNSLTVNKLGGSVLCMFDDGAVQPSGNTNPSVMDGNTIVGNGEDDYQLVFDTPVRVVAFRLLTNDAADEQITFKDTGGSTIATLDIEPLTGPNTRVFVGFYSPTPIKTIEIDTVGGASQNEGIDRIYVGDLFLEEMYLSDTEIGTDGLSVLYRVGLSEGTGEAILSPLDTEACAESTVADGIDGAVPYNNADVLAATPDGSYLVFIDDSASVASSRNVVKLDLASGDCEEVGILNWLDSLGAECPDGTPGSVAQPGDCNTDQGAFASDGTMFIGRNEDDTIHTLDINNAEATLLGPIVDQSNCSVVDLGGADLTFDADGNMWIWSNSGDSLYKVSQADLAPAECKDDATVMDVINAEFIGNNLTDPFTGLANRFNGLGNVVASARDRDDVTELDTTDMVDAATVADFAMTLDGSSFDHANGDMSSGRLELCGATTVGFYKNRIDGQVDDSLGGTTVDLCGFTLDDTQIDEIMEERSGRSYSQLAAQLLAAILNCDQAVDGTIDGNCNRAGVPVIADAEDFLCTDSAIAGDILSAETLVEEVFTRVDKDDRSEVGDSVDALDAYNNQGHDSELCAVFTEEEDE